MWYLEYEKAKVPAGGALVQACNAAPVPGHMKEAAGRAFHHKVLVVNGLAPLGAWQPWRQCRGGGGGLCRRRRQPGASHPPAWALSAVPWPR